MATNDFLVVAPGPAPNVASQATYAADPIVTTGNVSGVAKSAIINKALRQGTVMSAVLAQLIVDYTGANAVDDGTTATLLANLKLALAGRLIGSPKVFSASGTYTPSLGTKFIRIRAIGGGGGGGGCSATAAGQVAVGGGGSAGAYAEVFIANPGSQAVTIGTPGTAGVIGGNGGTGGSTSLGTLLVLVGGPGGALGAPASPPVINPGASATTGGTLPAGTVFSMAGTSGSPGIGISGASANGGGGGSSPLATGQSRSIGTGASGQGNGAGGSGAALGASTAGATGGLGSSGLMIIEEYA